MHSRLVTTVSLPGEVWRVNTSCCLHILSYMHHPVKKKLRNGQLLVIEKQRKTNVYLKNQQDWMESQKITIFWCDLGNRGEYTVLEVLTIYTICRYGWVYRREQVLLFKPSAHAQDHQVLCQFCSEMWGLWEPNLFETKKFSLMLTLRSVKVACLFVCSLKVPNPGKMAKIKVYVCMAMGMSWTPVSVLYLILISSICCCTSITKYVVLG